MEAAAGDGHTSPLDPEISSKAPSGVLVSAAALLASPGVCRKKSKSRELAEALPGKAATCNKRQMTILSRTIINMKSAGERHTLGTQTDRFRAVRHCTCLGEFGIEAVPQQEAVLSGRVEQCVHLRRVNSFARENHSTFRGLTKRMWSTA